MARNPGKAVTRYARRVSHTAQNFAEVVRFGGLETDEQESPYTVVAEEQTYRLRHYFADDTPADAVPVLLVPPLMMATEVWDVSQATSGVGALHAAGADPWVVDFGRPDHEPGGTERNLTDHVLAVSDAVDRVCAATGRDVVLAGYSQGGMFGYQAAAYRRGTCIDSLVTFGSPVDTTTPLPIPLAPEVVTRLANEIVESGLLRRLTVPSWFVKLGFRSLSPARTVQDRIRFLLALHDRDALLPRERQRQFLDNTGWTAYSGPAIAELLEQFVVHNRMLEGGFVIDDRLVTLADIDLPVLTFVGATDTLGHPDAVRAFSRAAPRAEVYETDLPGGHFGLVVGSKATEITWPTVAAWVEWRAGRGELPDQIRPAEQVEPGRTLRPSQAATTLAHATEFSIAVGRSAVVSAKRLGHLVTNVAREAPAQLPRLQRIEQIHPTTRISLGALLDEQARRRPEDIVFLFGDRAHRGAEVKRRVDNVVRGLISIGVRQGERVGVLMDSRPSAFTLVAALSRLGATAVLLRPDGDVPREAALGRVTWVISDPEHLARADDVTGDAQLGRPAWAVLGGGGESRELDGPEHRFIDMERIDPDEVALPAWYSPNPHLAGDVAFVLFTGEGEGTRALQITNRRWALSALGTASAATLRPGDTVFGMTPLYHSSAILMSIGGAVAGGARFAIASAPDPSTFWDEVRRYGATHVSYTWNSLHDIVEAPPNPAEQHHPIKMFIGSGMPSGLWRRTVERFPGVRVLEFYASAEGEAILANVSGRAQGSMGRPLPGTAEVRVAAYDLGTRKIELDAQGLAREAEVDEVGLLLARVEATDPTMGSARLRGVFEHGDAWRSTGDLFLRDADGDLWLAGPAREIVDTAGGPALPSGARFALAGLRALDTVVVYGVPDGDTGCDVLVAAVTVRGNAELTAANLTSALAPLPLMHRPGYVVQVKTIPMTTWHRPQWARLQKQGVPAPGKARRVWRRDADGAGYTELEA